MQWIARSLVCTFGALVTLGAPSAGQTVDAGRGPVPVHVPTSYDPAQPTPLLIALHGYSGNGPALEAWIQMTPLADQYGFLYLSPTGNEDMLGKPFWNATDACCDMFGTGQDDSTYLADLIDAVKAQFTVDGRRVYLFGHSNGGFMSYRMACDHADTIAAIASLAGTTWSNPASCSPDVPVAVLQIHGTADGFIFYAGGFLQAPYPGAVATVEQWAAYNGCSLVPDTTPAPLDLEPTLPGTESTVTRYATDCEGGASAELWTIVGGSHNPSLSVSFGQLIVEFFLAHPKAVDVFPYCTGKVTSQGCVPFFDVAGLGAPSVTDTNRFNLRGNDHVAGQGGRLIYAFKKSNLEFHGGKLCVKSPIVRMAGKVAKTKAAAACFGQASTGRLTIDFNIRIQGGNDPLLTAGQNVFAQWLQRDPTNTVGGFSDNFSDGIRFTILP